MGTVSVFGVRHERGDLLIDGGVANCAGAFCENFRDFWVLEEKKYDPSRPKVVTLYKHT